VRIALELVGSRERRALGYRAICGDVQTRPLPPAGRRVAHGKMVAWLRISARMLEPSVSLVMAAFDPKPQWLRDAVTSALGQADCNIELVVVDDGSPTAIVDILDDLQDPRLRVVRTNHGGVGHARNVGTAESRGRYLRFLDADDVFPPNSTAELLRVMAGRRDVIACGTSRVCRADLEPIFDWRVRPHPDALRALLLMRRSITPPSVMLVPRALVEAVGPWRSDLVVCEDLDYQVRLLEFGELACTRPVVVLYRQHPASASRDGTATWLNCAHIVHSYFERHPDQRATRLERQAHAALALLAAELASMPHGPWRDRRFWQALARDPSGVAYVHDRAVRPLFSRSWMRLRRALAQERG
jgi:GT2 family glycosyltransferase